METPEFLNTIADKPSDPYQIICKYRFCPKKEFTAERLNQQYCCNNHKVKENNFKAKKIRDKTKGIDFITRRNRKILEDFFNSGKTDVYFNDLELQGFNHKYSTHTEKGSDGKTRIPYYYEYGLVLISSDIWRQFKIIKQ
jgi:hypothetical protein